MSCYTINLWAECMPRPPQDEKVDRSVLLGRAGAILVDNFTIKGNSLGTVNWQGAAEWNTGFGVTSKNEQLDCGARFKQDVNNYLNTSGSQYKSVQVYFSA